MAVGQGIRPWSVQSGRRASALCADRDVARTHVLGLDIHPEQMFRGHPCVLGLNIRNRRFADKDVSRPPVLCLRIRRPKFAPAIFAREGVL